MIGFGDSEGVYQFKPTYLPDGKSAEEVRDEMLNLIKAAAPSYGVFSAESLGGFQRGMSRAATDATAPQSHIPEASQRSTPQYFTRGTQDFLIRDEAVASFVKALNDQGQEATYDQVEGAGHAFFDWKPNDQVKAPFAKYGVPYAAKMRDFFEKHLHAN